MLLDLRPELVATDASHAGNRQLAEMVRCTRNPPAEEATTHGADPTQLRRPCMSWEFKGQEIRVIRLLTSETQAHQSRTAASTKIHPQ